MKMIWIILTIIIIVSLTACNSQTNNTENHLDEKVNENSENLFEENKHTCPYGIKYDTKPRCGLWEDSDENGFCDLSE